MIVKKTLELEVCNLLNKNRYGLALTQSRIFAANLLAFMRERGELWIRTTGQGITIDQEEAMSLLLRKSYKDDFRLKTGLNRSKDNLVLTSKAFDYGGNLYGTFELFWDIGLNYPGVAELSGGYGTMDPSIEPVSLSFGGKKVGVEDERALSGNGSVCKVHDRGEWFSVTEGDTEKRWFYIGEFGTPAFYVYTFNSAFSTDLATEKLAA